MTSGRVTRHHAQNVLEQQRLAQQPSHHRQVRTRAIVAISLLIAVAGIIGAALYSSQPQQVTTSTAAPDFTLTDTSGATHALADYRGQNVVLYFSEGAGCQSCLLQMGEIEKMAAEFKAANITVLPIVMNTRDQIVSDMQANGVTTPFLLDDGTVSTAYGTIGKGMHGGLPGHSFVAIDAQGMQRWYGEYPGMWLNPQDLLTQAQAALQG
jgi:peroxiredoxin